MNNPKINVGIKFLNIIMSNNLFGGCQDRSITVHCVAVLAVVK